MPLLNLPGINFNSKKGNIHGKYNDDFPPNSEIRTLKLLSLKKKHIEQQNTFVNLLSKPNLQRKPR